MPTKIYNKLIRDGIPEVMDAKGLTYALHTIDGEALGAAMSAKIIEEAVEVAKANEALGQSSESELRQALVEELADLHEILAAFARHSGVSVEEIAMARAAKNAKRGAFEKGLFLESVEE